jgi:glyoxalase family protein
MACYKFVAPEGYSVVDVLATAHRLRVAAGAYCIQDVHLADAIAELTQRKAVPITEVVLT